MLTTKLAFPQTWRLCQRLQKLQTAFAEQIENISEATQGLHLNLPLWLGARHGV